ncbi:MAG TPA: UbiX family flavin prenyltransferase [Thermoanaerobaculia bacterium]|nr:UbiX family flavin prenyltransferase [Thermoanaerobaculia bacterium]
MKRGEARGKRFVVGISGASGVSLAVRFLQMAAPLREIETIHLVVTNNALRVAATELTPPASTPAGIVAAAVPPEDQAKIVHHPDADIAAIIASGSYVTDGMVIVPCSAGMLASIAAGISRGLVQRAADLTLKQRRPLLLALRETPYNLIHAENIVRATQAGAIVVPPIPAFYAGESWSDYLDHFAMRLLDLLGIEIDRSDLRWNGVHGARAARGEE